MLTFQELLLFVVAVVVFGSWVIPAIKAYAENRREFALKRDMVARGMSGDEIARVINAHGHPPDEAVALPCASQVVVHSDGEWHEALVLKVADGRYFVHYVGTEMDENEWVEQDRVRFPADSVIPSLVAEAVHAPRNGAPGKGPLLEEV